MRLIGLLLILLAGLTVGAQEVHFTVSAPSVVELGEQFRLAYTIDKKGTNLQVPTLEGFDLLMGPTTSSSSSFSSINGKVTQSEAYTYTYVLEGVKEGTFQIPAATIQVDGKQYRSNSVKIQVVKGSGNSSGNARSAKKAAQPDVSAAVNENNLFVRVEVNRRSVYLGESLTATIKIYTKVELVNFGRSKFPSFDGFLSEEIPTAQNIQLERETYDGQVYNVGVIRKVLLFPQHTGEITIEPFELECIVRQRSSGSQSFFDDFFGNYRDVKALRTSRPLTVNVKELPQEGRPLGFSGTVGDVTMHTSVSADTINANEALTYRITFSGNGNLKLLATPSVNFPPDFETYEPKVTKDIKTGENGMSGTVTYEYVVIPRYSGVYTIPAQHFSFFDIRTNSYKTLTGKDYTISVRKGSEKGQDTGGPAVQSFKKEDVRFLGKDIRYIKTGNLGLHSAGGAFFGTTEYWLALIIPFVLFVVGTLLNRRRIKANADLVKVKNKAATKMARKRMKAAAVAMKGHNADIFYEEVLKGLWGYVSYKLNIDKAELNRDNISDILKRKTVDDSLIAEFINVLDDCEFARYAPESDSGKQMDKVYEESIAIITKLDKAIR